MRELKPIHVALLAALLWLGFYGGQLGGCSLPVLAPKVTAATYTYEKDTTAIPPAVSAALNTLNHRGIVATNDEVDTKNGGGGVPAQYAVSRPAAVAAGLPALVVMGGDKVIRVVKAPTTEQQVLEAVP